MHSLLVAQATYRCVEGRVNYLEVRIIPSQTEIGAALSKRTGPAVRVPAAAMPCRFESETANELVSSQQLKVHVKYSAR